MKHHNRQEIYKIDVDAPLALISNTMDAYSYLNDPAYRSFYNGTVAIRSDQTSTTTPERVIVSSDDGFVYAFNQSNGGLGRGWIPRALVKELKDHTSFQGKHYMQGKIGVLDLKDGSGNYASYVIGSYKQGLGQYVLKLSANSGLDSLIWDVDNDLNSGSAMDAAPNNGECAYFPDASGAGDIYAAGLLSSGALRTGSAIQSDINGAGRFKACFSLLSKSENHSRPDKP